MFSKSVLALVSTLATFVASQDTIQSAAFTLKIISTNETLNGSSLFACHEGAAIEGLCQAGQMTTIPTVAETFQFNYSSAQAAPTDPSIGITGLLSFLLETSSVNVSEPMLLYTPLSSNVALPLFSPGQSGTSVAFDSKDLLNIQDYVSDTVYPPTYTNATAYYRWYVCTTYYQGYTYPTLNWVFGEFPPQNPTCQKVDVQRVFV